MEDRADIFAEIIVHLDYVASVDREEYGGSNVSARIYNTLIPFCEREGGFQTDEPRIVELYQNR